MSPKEPLERYIILYIPWLLSVLLSSTPNLSYLIAWLGSFFIFYISLSGKIKPLPDDLSISQQLMRPIILVQIIFAGYMCCTSIFYYLSVIGYDNFHANNNFYLVDQAKLSLTAQCQRYYCLGHASLTTGILLFMNYPSQKKYHVEKGRIANLLLIIALISLPVSILFLEVPGLSQFYFQFSALSVMAGTLALAFAIPLKNIRNTLICLFLYLSNFYQALLSGYKEPIILSILVLGLLLYPSYKKIVLIIFVPALLIVFAFLPTYNHIFRENAWSDDVDASEASQIALDAALDQTDGQNETNWDFLIYRLSEIDMFTKFAQSTPSQINFYGFQLLKQSVIAIVPRVFWPSKPNTEDLIMERVYNAGVIYRGSQVSAKPAFIVDAYLSGGVFGIFISLFIYGAAAQIISIKAEELFGGYTLGTALIFSGLFQIFWRGMSFEFIVNSVFWSYISMLIIFKILKAYNVLTEI